MIPAATALAKTDAAPKLRAGFFYIPHGAVMSNTKHGKDMDRRTPSGAGADFKLSHILEPLEKHKHAVISLSNLENKASVASVHKYNPATWLSGVKPDPRSPHRDLGDRRADGDAWVARPRAWDSNRSLATFEPLSVREREFGREKVSRGQRPVRHFSRHRPIPVDRDRAMLHLRR
jgi:hypothetical protein